MTPKLKELIDEAKLSAGTNTDLEYITKLAQACKIMAEALELVKEKAPWCDCMDAPGIAKTAQQEVEKLLDDKSSHKGSVE